MRALLPLEHPLFALPRERLLIGLPRERLLIGLPRERPEHAMVPDDG